MIPALIVVDGALAATITEIVRSSIARDKETTSKANSATQALTMIGARARKARITETLAAHNSTIVGRIPMALGFHRPALITPVGRTIRASQLPRIDSGVI